ncbi:MAG: hypothetical protein J7M26_03850, partial [Armatimonadetes bacterium]|nr:hypothetical protein [Armatimonadota bacterium]
MKLPDRIEVSAPTGPEGLEVVLAEAASRLKMTLELCSPLLPEPVVASPVAGAGQEAAASVGELLGPLVDGATQAEAGALGSSGEIEATLLAGREEIGHLRARAEEHEPSAGQRKAFEALARWVAGLLQREMEADCLVRELAGAYDQLSLACELAEELRLADNERHLADLLLEHLGEVVANDGGVVMVENEAEGDAEEREPFRVVAVRGLAVADLPRVAEGCRWLYEPESRGAGVAGGLLLSAGEVGLSQPDGQVLIALLQAEPRVRGALVLARRATSAAFHSSEARLVVAAARQAAVSMANLRLRTRL